MHTPLKVISSTSYLRNHYIQLMQDALPEPRYSSRRGFIVGSVGGGWTQHGEQGALGAVGGRVVTLPAGVIGS